MAEPSMYLDHPATSFPKAPGVAEAMVDAMGYGNPGRSSHRLAARSTDLIESVRGEVARHLDLPDPAGVVFTSGATASLNLALQGVLRPGDHIVTTCLDHNSVLRPLQLMAERCRCSFSVVRRPRPDLEFVEQLVREIRPETRLVALTHASNVLGAVLPVAKVAAAAHERGVRVLLDAAQTAGHLRLSLRELQVDLVAFGAHKGLLGPTGVGVLASADPALDLAPLVVGGTGSFSDELSPPRILPHAYEAGTPNTPAIAGLGVALRFADSPEHAQLRYDVDGLHRTCVAELATIPQLRLYHFPEIPSVPVLSFALEGWPPRRLAEALERGYGLQARAGLHCAPAAHHALGTFPEGAVRVGFGPGNSLETVDRLASALRRLAAY